MRWAGLDGGFRHHSDWKCTSGFEISLARLIQQVAKGGVTVSHGEINSSQPRSLPSISTINLWGSTADLFFLTRISILLLLPAQQAFTSNASLGLLCETDCCTFLCWKGGSGKKRPDDQTKLSIYSHTHTYSATRF